MRTAPDQDWFTHRLDEAHEAFAETDVDEGAESFLDMVRIRRHDAMQALRWLACGMVALCYVAHGIVHIAYARAGGGRTAWLIVARKIPTIAAALLIGAVGTGLSAIGVAGLLALPPAHRSSGASGTAHVPTQTMATIPGASRPSGATHLPCAVFAANGGDLLVLQR